MESFDSSIVMPYELCRKPIGNGFVILASFRDRLSRSFRDHSLTFRGHTLFDTVCMDVDFPGVGSREPFYSYKMVCIDLGTRSLAIK